VVTWGVGLSFVRVSVRAPDAPVPRFMLQDFLLGDAAVIVDRPFCAPQKPADPSKQGTDAAYTMSRTLWKLRMQLSNVPLKSRSNRLAQNGVHSTLHSKPMQSEREGHAQEQTDEEHEHTVRAAGTSSRGLCE
jgi:hypothetical protein